MPKVSLPKGHPGVLLRKYIFPGDIYGRASPPPGISPGHPLRHPRVFLPIGTGGIFSLGHLPLSMAIPAVYE